MPSGKRTQIKTLMARSINNVDRAVIPLVDLEEMFRPQHEPYADYLSNMIEALLTVREWQLDFWEKAWGSSGENYRSYI